MLIAFLSGISAPKTQSFTVVYSYIQKKYLFALNIVSDGCWSIQQCCVFILSEPTSDKGEKLSNSGPQFTSGVIMKMTDSKPLPGRKIIKAMEFNIFCSNSEAL